MFRIKVGFCEFCHVLVFTVHPAEEEEIDSQNFNFFSHKCVFLHYLELNVLNFPNRRSSTEENQ